MNSAEFVLWLVLCGLVYVVYELAKQRKIFARWDRERANALVAEREDAAAELNYWREEEWRAIEYVRQVRPKYRADFVWDGWKTPDQLFIDEHSPKNWPWRLQVEKLRRTCALLEAPVQAIRNHITDEAVAELCKLLDKGATGSTERSS
jgi:hypothetical protein